MSQQIISFIMSGGVGSRLWPLSRQDNPKQFHNLAGDGSMLAKTISRLSARPGSQQPIFIIASERHADRLQEAMSLHELHGGGALYEPIGRNTAAAVALATIKTLEAFGDQLVLVIPSDHEISTPAQFWGSVETGVKAAHDGRVVVFGIPPSSPEIGYGYIETGKSRAVPQDVIRFVEKPDLETAKSYLAAGNFYWNAGIFLFKARVMKAAFEVHQPDIWARTIAAYRAANEQVSGTFLPLGEYEQIPSDSIDYAIMERLTNISMVPADFSWSDLGSWQAIMDASPSDTAGNVLIGDVVAIDCEDSYIRSDGRLLSAFGMKGVAIVSTADAIFVAPVRHSQHVKKIVEQLEKSGRLETKFTPAHDRIVESGAWRNRVSHWLFNETLPLWSTAGVDKRYGGFHEALGIDGKPLAKPKRMRTMARQIYAFAVAKIRGWDGPADQIIAQGLDFIQTKGRTPNGGWIRTLNTDGTVADPTEDTYDHSCVLLALAFAHECGNPDALRLGQETFAFLDEHLEDKGHRGFFETADGRDERRSNPHMHLLEAFLAWHDATGDCEYLVRSQRIVDLFQTHFFDADTWTLGEFFDQSWVPAPGMKGKWTEPGHHFEWASLLVDFANRSGQKSVTSFARKLYASAIANGLNRSTGLAYGAVSKEGNPLDGISRSWPQTEAIKAAIALNKIGGPDLRPEFEERVGRLFRWHIDPAPTGMWIDRIDENGRAAALEVPASIFYHLVYALTAYLDATEPR